MRRSEICRPVSAGTIIHVSLSIRRATSEKSDVPERESACRVLRRRSIYCAPYERASHAAQKRCGERGGSARWELRKRMEEVNVVGPK